MEVLRQTDVSSYDNAYMEGNSKMSHIYHFIIFPSFNQHFSHWL